MSEPVQVVYLGVISGDDLAARVLASWLALELRLAEPLSASAARIAELQGLAQPEVLRSLERCRAARLLLDGDIAEPARQWVETKLAAELRSGGSPRGRRAAS